MTPNWHLAPSSAHFEHLYYWSVRLRAAVGGAGSATSSTSSSISTSSTESTAHSSYKAAITSASTLATETCSQLARLSFWCLSLVDRAGHIWYRGHGWTRRTFDDKGHDSAPV